MLRSILVIISIFISLLSVGQSMSPGAIAVKIRSTPNARTSGFPIDLAEITTISPLNTNQSNARTLGSILDNIYIIATDTNPEKLAAHLATYPEVIYAEVIPQEELLHIPNDPLADPNSGGQGYLSVIKAYDAWDITTGNPDIIISINDTGMDMFHDDLVGNYYSNPLEVENGIDDDNNGYIDDIIGYDFADNDNDPHAETEITSLLNHGTHMGGIAGATANNSLGIAGVAYNSKIAPHKGFTTIGAFSSGTWEGVLYAADNGYDIANLSWGSTSGFSQFFQDVIDYCVLEKDMVIIASAGNTHGDFDYYPASYEHVISVGASDNSDIKWSSGTYSHHIDIMAPGVNILSTQKNNSYGTDSGSSDATPMVSGAAALVKSVFPTYNARQIMEQLRVTADDIYDKNPSHPYQLGKGRLNAFKAVTESNAQSLRIQNFDYINAFGKYAFWGDTITLSFDMINYLSPLNGPTISLESDSPYVTILDGEIQPGSFSTMESRDGFAIKILLASDTPPETEIDLRFLMEENSYADFQNVSFVTEPNDFTFGDDMTLRVGGDGSVGYLTPNYSDGSQMTFNSIPVLRYGGLMIGTGTNDLHDNVTNSFTSPTSRDDDFKTEENIHLVKRDGIPLIGRSDFTTNDDSFWMEQSVIPSTDQSYIILHYRVVNQTQSPTTDTFAGFFADYYLGNQSANHAIWDGDLQSLIMYDDSQSTYAALSMLEDSYTHVALDMQAENGNGRDIEETFTDNEKFGFLSGADIEEAGTEGIGNDVATLVAKNLGIIQPGEDRQFALVLTLANDLSELATNLSSASSTYDLFLANPETEEIFYTCYNTDAIVNPTKGTNYNFYEDAFASDFIQSGAELTIPNLSKDTTLYIENVDGSFPSAIRKIKVKPIDDIANFSSSVDTLYLDNDLNFIELTDLSVQPLSWLWDFDNNTHSTLQNPTLFYDTPGVYEVNLTVDSDLGCTESYSKELVVASRPASPTIEDLTICPGAQILLTHPSEEYAVYDQKGNRLLKQSNLSLGPFARDSTLFIAQWVGGFESLPQELNVFVEDVLATYEVYPDTLASQTSALFIHSETGTESIEWTVNTVVESTGNELIIPIDGSFDLMLEVANSNCNASLSETLSFAPSEIPVLSDMNICSGEQAIIRPSNGTYFGFYSDAGLTQLLHKGTQLKLENLTNDQTLYVVGLDNIVPSPAVETTISIGALAIEILATPPTLDLNQGSKVNFSIQPSASTTSWFIDDQLVETSSAPILFFDTIGEYEIKAVATSTDNCLASTTYTLTVHQDINVLGRPTDHQFFYPNPSNGIIHIPNPEIISNMSIFDLTGRLIVNHPTVQRQMTLELPRGAYILNLDTQTQSVHFKILIK